MNELCKSVEVYFIWLKNILIDNNIENIITFLINLGI